MNKLSDEKRVQIIKTLVEGNSLRSTARICDVAFNTILKLLPEIGYACWEYQDNIFRNLKCRKIQCDEIWSFCYSKQSNVPEKFKGLEGFGDVWTHVAIDADTKLVPCWAVGRRDFCTAKAFISDLKDRLACRVQLTTDGHRAYIYAIEEAFGDDIDYGQLQKLYAPERATHKTRAEARYSPGQCCGTRLDTLIGNPVIDDISTSFIERQNLTMRMSMRRFTRLTNGFSKKLENHWHAIALHYMHYNFCRIHQSLRVTPAMAAGITDHVWGIEEIVGLITK